MGTPGTTRLGAVEGLRAVAATLVVAYHLHRALQLTHPGFLAGTTDTVMARLGPFGVSIFFVLSGFLLYRPYALATLRSERGPHLGTYYLRRFVRIFPAYWLALGVFVATASTQVITSRADVWTYGALLQNYRTGYLLRGIGVAWTLAIEVSFYLVLPLLAWLLRGPAGSARRALIVRQITGITALAAVGISVRIWTLWFKTPGGAQFGAFEPWRSPSAWLPGYLDWFALGMLLAAASAWAATGGGWPPVVRWLAHHAGVAWLVAAGAYVLVAFAATFPPPGLRYPPTTQMIVTTVFPLAAALMVLPIVLEPGGGGLRTILRSPPLVAIGTVSYGIYLWHLPAIRWTQSWIADGTIPRSAVIQGLLVVTITGAAATLSYVLVERPLMRWSARAGRRDGRWRPVGVS
jgi:peptidoglycan/LPS O-acetylase OafA/YrhL